MLIELNLIKLRLISFQQFINDENRRLQNVHKRCNRLCMMIQESILFINELSSLIASLVEINSITLLLRSNRLTFTTEIVY